MLVDVIEERNESSSAIIATRISVGIWHELTGESTDADAILDRAVFSVHRINLKKYLQEKNSEPLKIKPLQFYLKISPLSSGFTGPVSPS